MTKKPWAQTAGALMLIVLCLGGGAWLQTVRDTRHPAPPIPEDSLYITSGRTLKLMTTGFNALAADLYWIRTIQYYGRTKLKTRDSGWRQGPIPTTTCSIRCSI
jgi:hypothetical protein